MTKETYPSFTAIVPSYNESTRFLKVIQELLKVSVLDELILVDDGSSDETKEVLAPFVKDIRFKYVKHPKNRGKGAAMQTGVGLAKNEVILFLDADLENITASKILKIVTPVLSGDVDMSRGSFSMKRGRVTEFAVKPMMEILFPGVYFEQPISGQVCAKKSFLAGAEFTSLYGLDIGLLFDAINSGQRIVEVDIGKLTHRAHSVAMKTEMSRQVLEAMISRAGLIRHKYKLVLFNLDNNLVYAARITRLFTQLGINQHITDSYKRYQLQDITAAEYFARNALLFKGMKVSILEDLMKALPTTPYISEVIQSLRKRRYRVGIISSHFSPLVESFAGRLQVDLWNGVRLEVKNGEYTGKIEKKSAEWMVDTFEKGFSQTYGKILLSQKVKTEEVIMVASEQGLVPLLKTVGLGVAYKPGTKELKHAADKTIQVHAELLAIIE